MKYRLMDWLVCPDCGSDSLNLKVVKETKIKKVNPGSACRYVCGRTGEARDFGAAVRLEMTDFELLSGWISWPDNPDFVINQTGAARAALEFQVEQDGAYRLSLLGIPGNKVAVDIDGRPAGEVSRPSDSLRLRSYLGEIDLDAGPHRIEVHDAGGSAVSYINSVFLEPSGTDRNGVDAGCGECYSAEIEEAVISCGCGKEFKVVDGIPFMLPESCAGTVEENTTSEDPDRYKKAEIAISDNQLSDAFFESQGDLPFDPNLPNRTLDFISRFDTATQLLTCGVGDLVLDNAVGTAWTSQWLVRLGFEVIATEICVDYLKSGIRRMGRDFVAARPLHLVVCDSENLPFRSDIVEGVLSFDSFHHMLDRGAVVKGFDRVLRAGGKAVFVEPGADHESASVSVWVNQRYGILERGITLEQLEDFAADTDFVDFAKRNFNSHNSDVIILRKKGVREYTSKHPDQLKASLKAIDPPDEVSAGEICRITIRAVNTGDTRWLDRAANGRGRVLGLADLYTDDVDLIMERFANAALPAEVSPGEYVDLVFEFTAPKMGSYLVQFDLCVEGLLCFKDYEFNPLNLRLLVT